MTKRALYMVDSFTTTPFSGNPAGVIYPADGLTDDKMIALSREIGASESAFIYHHQSGDKEIRIRFFTPAMEMAICTHATVAAFHILATIYHHHAGPYRMHSGGGLFDVHCDGVMPHPTTSLVQPDGGLVRMLSIEEERSVAAALGLEPTIFEGVIYRAATPRVLLALDTKEALNALVVDRTALVELGNTFGVPGFYCYTFDGCEAGVLATTRMFSPATGVDEDPVTGNAAAALALYHRYSGLIADRATVRYAQGEAMGRAGSVTVAVDGGWAIISGQAVTVWEGSLLL